MDALRTEVEFLHNIKVTNILPGFVATNVSRNAITSDGSTRGRSEETIDNGDDPADCAASILDAIVANSRELIFAKGRELEMAKLRHQDADTFFDLVSGFGRHIIKTHDNEG